MAKKNFFKDLGQATAKQIFNLNGIFIILGFVLIIFNLAARDIFWKLGLPGWSDYFYYSHWIGTAILVFVFCRLFFGGAVINFIKDYKEERKRKKAAKK